jgi:hypothetical protein
MIRFNNLNTQAQEVVSTNVVLMQAREKSCSFITRLRVQFSVPWSERNIWCSHLQASSRTFRSVTWLNRHFALLYLMIREDKLLANLLATSRSANLTPACGSLLLSGLLSTNQETYTK